MFDRKIRVLVCSIHLHLLFNSSLIKLLLIFKDENTPSLKANNRLKFSQYVAISFGREKGEPQYKLSYKVLKEEDGYYSLRDIYPYLTLI